MTATTELKGYIIESTTILFLKRIVSLRCKTKIDELEKQCSRLKNWGAEREQYSLRQIGRGKFAYVRNDFHGNIEQTQKLCAGCYNKTIKAHFNNAK